MKLAFFSTKSYDKEYFTKLNQSQSVDISFFEIPLNQNTASLAKGHDAVCIFVNDKADKDIIEQLGQLNVKLIALRCAGFNNVDLKTAKEQNITVVRVPSYSPEAVAEHATALLLTLLRKTHKAFNRIREGNFSLERLTGMNIFRKTVGVIGTGKIGKTFCRIMKGFECEIYAFDIHKDPELESMNVKYTDLDHLFEISDIISLHCPLNQHTHHIIDKESLEKMKDGVIIINTSRGALIHTKAAIKALKSGKIGLLGIDVYEQEENLFFNDRSEHIIHDDEIARLITFPNVLITGHQGFFTKEALEEIAATTLSNITKFSQGISSGNEVMIE